MSDDSWDSWLNRSRVFVQGGDPGDEDTESIGIKIDFSDLNHERENEPKCTCGSWSTYGKKWNKELHAHYCDILKGYRPTWWM